MGALPVAAIVLASAMMTQPVAAQTYPNRPIRIISPFAAGGSNDVIARIIGQKMAEITPSRVWIFFPTHLFAPTIGGVTDGTK